MQSIAVHLPTFTRASRAITARLASVCVAAHDALSRALDWPGNAAFVEAETALLNHAIARELGDLAQVCSGKREYYSHVDERVVWRRLFGVPVWASYRYCAWADWQFAQRVGDDTGVLAHVRASGSSDYEARASLLSEIRKVAASRRMGGRLSAKTANANANNRKAA